MKDQIQLDDWYKTLNDEDKKLLSHISYHYWWEKNKTTGESKSNWAKLSFHKKLQLFGKSHHLRPVHMRHARERKIGGVR